MRFALAFLAASVAAVRGQVEESPVCPFGGYYASTAGKCYIRSPGVYLNYAQAMAQCSKITATLPSFASEEELVEFGSITQLMGGGGLELWLGCTDEETEGEWVCEGNDSPLMKWATSYRGDEPNGKEAENCAVFSSFLGAMADSACGLRSIRRAAVCVVAACEYEEWSECEFFAADASCGTGTRSKKTSTIGCQPTITEICSVECTGEEAGPADLAPPAELQPPTDVLGSFDLTSANFGGEFNWTALIGEANGIEQTIDYRALFPSSYQPIPYDIALPEPDEGAAESTEATPDLSPPAAYLSYLGVNVSDLFNFPSDFRFPEQPTEFPLPEAPEAGEAPNPDAYNYLGLAANSEAGEEAVAPEAPKYNYLGFPMEEGETAEGGVAESELLPPNAYGYLRFPWVPTTGAAQESEAPAPSGDADNLYAYSGFLNEPWNLPQ